MSEPTQDQPQEQQSQEQQQQSQEQQQQQQQQQQEHQLEQQQSTESSENESQQAQQPSSQDDEKQVNAASAKEGGREVSNKILYVGNLPKSASEETIQELFSVGGNPVKTIKILNDKNKAGFNYAFIEYDTNEVADMALNTLNGRLVDNVEIKVNWAFQSAAIAGNPNNTEEPLFNIFVGDLSPEVNDEGLRNAFSKFESLKQAHVMWDMQTSRSRGYGFVTFGNQSDAELALQTMNGEWLCGRAIRCNWASHKQQQQQQHYNNQHGGGYSRGYRNNNGGNNNNRQFRQFNNINNGNNNGFSQPLVNNNPQFIGQQPPQPDQHQHQQQQQQQQQQQSVNGANGVPQQMLQGLTNGNLGPGTPINGSNNAAGGFNNNGTAGNVAGAPVAGGPGAIPVMSPQSYDIVLRQTPSWQTTVYLGNIAHFTQQQELIPLLQNFGFIVDFKFHPERGCAFVKYDTHERAALAIIQLAGFNLNGRPLKCGWGKERPPQFQNFPRNGNMHQVPMYGPGGRP